MANPTVVHASLTGAAANPDVLVDGPKWDAAHSVSGMENVDNTSDANKPVSTAQAAADAVVAANAAIATNLTSGTVPAGRMPAFTGDITTVAGAVATTLATVNGNVGTFGSATQSVTVTFNAKGLATAASASTITPAVGSITGLGTGVATALAVNVGTAGSPVVNGGALGSPSSAGTIPAFTLGGTIAGGGNQLNNIIIGTTTPLAASFTTVNKVTITAPGTAATLTLTNNTTVTGPAASGTIMTLGNAETVTGVKQFGSAGAVGKLAIGGSTSGATILDATPVATGTLTLPAATDTLVGKATTDVFTNKTLDSAGSGNVLQVGSVTLSKGQYPGETTTGSATAGNVGEYIEGDVLSGSAVALTTTVPANMTSISLTAGDWDVWGSVVFVPSSTMTAAFAAPSTTSATLPTPAPNKGAYFALTLAFTSAAAQIISTGARRYSLSGTTTIFLVCQATFAGTNSVYGTLVARRAR